MDEQLLPLTTRFSYAKGLILSSLRRVKTESQKAGLYLNTKKTKIMTTADWDKFEVDGEELEVVTSFPFLGSTVEKEGRCEMEVKRRMALSMVAMRGL